MVGSSRPGRHEHLPLSWPGGHPAVSGGLAGQPGEAVVEWGLTTLGKHAARKWSPRSIRRLIWIGVLGAVAVMLTLVILLFQSFKDAEPHDPAQARNELEERTPEEVRESREMIEELEETLSPRLEQPPEDELSVVVYSTEPEEEDPPIQGSDETSVSPEVEAEDPIEIPTASSPPLPDGMFNAVVLVGADASGYLADSIILALFPEGGSAPALVSIPRDLYLYNFCSDDYRRVNANLGGCTGWANGPELLSLAIEEFTGVEVDHYVRINFEGFVELVDGLGGVQICFEYPTYDEKAGLDIREPSCRTDGATALAYARSRNATQLVEGGVAPGMVVGFQPSATPARVAAQTCRAATEFVSRYSGFLSSEPFPYVPTRQRLVDRAGCRVGLALPGYRPVPGNPAADSGRGLPDFRRRPGAVARGDIQRSAVRLVGTGQALVSCQLSVVTLDGIRLAG